MRSWALLLFVVGCGGDDVAVDASGTDATTTSDAPTASDAPTTPPDVAVDAPPPCVGLTGNACRACCTTSFSKGAKVAENAGHTCACQPAYCLSQCGTTLCEGGAPSTPCDTCYSSVIGKGGDAGCYDEITTACAADPDCKAYDTCFKACK